MNRSDKSFQTILFHVLLSTATLLSLYVAVAAQEDESHSNSPRTGAITGHVVNENGQPLSHVAIYVSALKDPLQTRATVTDVGGNFEVSGLDALLYSINTSAPTYITPPREPEALPTYYRIGDSVTISLIRGGVITGTVTSATGEPLVQAGVRAIMIRDANGKTGASSPGRFAVDRPTDDRGMYRIYGLPAGTYIVSAGGRAVYGYGNNAYDIDAPTYAPSSTRDTALEIVVRAGEETAVDIRYRGEAGHAVSGFISGPVMPNSGANVSLTQIVNGMPLSSAIGFQTFSPKGFAFYGVGDGDYDLIAQSGLGIGETIASEARRITVKGADVSGIELVVRELGSIRGRMVLEPSSATECKSKRQPLFSETVLMTRRSEKGTPREQLAFSNVFAQSVPGQSGDFALRNLAPGRFKLNVRFYAKYWYLRSILRENPAAAATRTPAASRPIDLARNGINLKFGERINGVTVTLAAGAASLRGIVTLPEGESLPPRLYLHLVPAEKENAEDVLRFFTTAVPADGKFAFNNLAPGRYWVLARQAVDNEPLSDATLRTAEESDARLKIRRAAEGAKNEVEFKPCQNIVDYQLPFKTSVKD
jgi:hypothetical protein